MRDDVNHDATLYGGCGGFHVQFHVVRGRSSTVVCLRLMIGGVHGSVVDIVRVAHVSECRCHPCVVDDISNEGVRLVLTVAIVLSLSEFMQCRRAQRGSSKRSGSHHVRLGERLG